MSMDEDAVFWKQQCQALRLTWTHEKPTVPGWYWHRVQYQSNPEAYLSRVREVLEYNVGGLFVVGYGDVQSMNGEWAGPIEQPEEK
jgi:hypothetical protein